MTRPIPTRSLRSYSRAVVALLVLGAIPIGTSAATAALTTQKCLVLKRQAWGNLRKCEATEQVKQLKGKPGDLTKCQTNFQEKLANITEKARVAAIACRYGDNADSTVTDYDTGLQWEQKSGFGGLCLVGNVHCVTDRYTWDEANRFVDGSSTGTSLTSCFFGYCDWRLPTIVELQTILLQPFVCSSSPCIDPIFGPTATDQYWSSTTTDGFAPNAWNVNFNDGAVQNNFKEPPRYAVRAVRNAF